MKKAHEKLRNLAAFIRENRLFAYVVRDVVREARDYPGDSKADRVLARLDDIACGLCGGIVRQLVYYSDTTKFFNKFSAEISEILAEAIEEMGGANTGYVLGDSDKWDKSDPLALERHNKNLLAWFAYEEVACRFKEYLLSNEGQSALTHNALNEEAAAA